MPPSLRREVFALTGVSVLCGLFSLFALWYVASSPDLPIRCALSDASVAELGLPIRYGPAEDDYKGKLEDPPKQAEDAQHAKVETPSEKAGGDHKTAGEEPPVKKVEPPAKIRVLPQPDDRLVSLGGRTIRSFIDYTRLLGE